MKTQTLPSVSIQTQEYVATSSRKFFLFVLSLVILLTLFGGQTSFAQGTAISDQANPTPNANAILDLKPSITSQKTLIIPRLTTALTSGTEKNGMMFYDSTNQVFKFRQNAAWVTFSTTGGFVDLTTAQTAAGAKTWSALGTFTGGITATGTTAISLGADNTTKTITLGNTTAGTVSQTNINAGTGGLNLGTTADARTIAIGTGAAIQTINIGTGAVANVITIGSTSAAAGVSISGTTNASSATAGFVGEVLTATTAANTTSLATATSANVLSSALSLTAGDWDVWGVVNYTTTTTTAFTITSAGISTTSATLGAQDTYYKNYRASYTPCVAIVISEVVPMQRINVSATTPVYLVANATFSASTINAGGTLWARRRR